MILLAAALALLGLTGTRLAMLTAARDESRATTAVRGALWAFATLVTSLAALGACGLLGPRAMLVPLALAAAGAIAVGRRQRASGGGAGAAPVDRAPLRAGEAALLVALAAALALRLWAGLHKTTFLYDTLSYHLHVPAVWMHEGRLSMVPAVFGDPAPAYAPANLELWFFALMAPLRSDYLAATGQLPLAALAALAIAATVRESGGRRAHALAAGLAFLLVPEVWQQASTAMVDLGMAAFFLAALPFLVRLGRGPRAPAAGDVAALGLALGLCVGTKVVGLVLALPLMATAGVLIARAGRRAPAALGIAAAAALAAGGFWYLRNLAATGNPLYPATVGAGGHVLFPGLYDGAAMRASDYHAAVTDWRALLEILDGAGIGFGLGALWALAVALRPPWVLLAVALVALGWLVVPYQESRFFFPVFGVAAVAMGRAGVVPLALALAGALGEVPTAGRWTVAAAAALGPMLRAGTLRLDRRAAAVVLAVGAVAATVAVAAGLRAYRGRDPRYGVGDALAQDWSWFRAHVRGARVAYTGVNLPFPLGGADLANDVRYVNVAGGPGDLAHDFPPPADQRDPEPAPYRAGARFETWLANLRAARTEVLFVAALYPEVRRTIAADADGFPVERAWADAHPGELRLLHASAVARVYALERR